MARLKIVDEAHAGTLYQDLDRGLGGKVSRVIGNNTQLVRLSGHSIAVRLHSTNVVVVWESGTVEYNHGGWHTPTTVDRINSVAHKFHERAYIKHGYLNLPGEE